MRISTSMMMSNYTKILESKMGDIQKYSDQVSSGMAFDRPSDDPVAAMQTIQACHQYTQNQQFQTSDNSASSWMQATESTINQMNDILKSAQEKATEVINGTNNPSDDGNIATAMTSYRNELVTTLNSSFNGTYIFGGSTTGNAPFQLDSDGNLEYYNYNASTPGYVPVSGMSASDLSSMRLSMPVDLNLGVKVAPGGTVDPTTVFNEATSGLDTVITGWSDGTDDGSSNGKALNIVDQLTTAINNLNSGSSTGVSDFLGQVQDAQNAVLKVDVGVGERTNMLKFISSKLSDDQSNITTQLSNVMDVDPAEAIMQYNMSQTVYKASLSVTSTVLQQSLIDFLK